MDQKKLKLRKAIRGYLDKDRSRLIPEGEIVEPTSIIIDGRIRVHWSGSKEGLGFLMVDQNELESWADPI